MASLLSRLTGRFRDAIQSLPGYFGRRETQSYWPNRAQRVVYIQSTIAGVRVTPDTALQSATVWACVNVLSKSIAQLPWRMMREVAPGSSMVCPGALDDLLNHRPNPEMSAYTFRQTMVGHLVTWGNAYAEIERDNAGRPVALWPIEPDRVFVRRWWDTNRLYYQVNNQTKGIVDLDFCDMFHVHGLAFDGITGYRTVGYGAQSIGLAMAIERFGASFFGNNCQFGGFVENTKSNLSPEAREALLGSLNEKHRGPDQSFRVQYLDAGMKFTPINVEPEKGQFIAAREHQIEEICRLFGVPPHKVAQLIRATNNNIEHQGIEFVVDGILPLTSLFEQEADYKLINSRNPMGYFTRIDVRSLQRGDLAARQTFYSSMFDRGVLSPNDIREMEGLNPIDDEEGGNKRFVPLNFQLLEDAGAPDETPPNNSNGSAASPDGAPAEGTGDAGGDTSESADEGASSVDSKSRRTIAPTKKKPLNYSPDQPRDERGRWTSGGGGSAPGGKRAEKALAKGKEPTFEMKEKLSSSEENAVDSYKSYGYKGINSVLRGEVQGNPEIQAEANDVRAAVAKGVTTSDGVLYRGISHQGAEQFKQGDKVTFSGLMSTSTDEQFARDFNSRTLLRIYAPKGSTALNFDKAMNSYGDVEHEVILDHGSTFYVRGVSGNTVDLVLRRR